jgi:hypothetical protein
LDASRSGMRCTGSEAYEPSYLPDQHFRGLAARSMVARSAAQRSETTSLLRYRAAPRRLLGSHEAASSRSPGPLHEPPRGSSAAAPRGALRAIDRSACPRSWRTCGSRRLRRQSQLRHGYHSAWYCSRPPQCPGGDGQHLSRCCPLRWPEPGPGCRPGPQQPGHPTAAPLVGRPQHLG